MTSTCATPMTGAAAEEEGGHLGLVGEGMQLHPGGLNRGALLKLHAPFAGVPHLAPVCLLQFIGSSLLRQQLLEMHCPKLTGCAAPSRQY